MVEDRGEEMREEKREERKGREGTEVETETERWGGERLSSFALRTQCLTCTLEEGRQVPSTVFPVFHV